MESIELLAPAGNMDSLTAAVENGADAVYLGGSGFNARQYAGNFNNEEIQRAIDYCHLKGVKVFVTVNILLKDCELYTLPEYIAFLYNCGADALIIQDIGAGQLIKDIVPGFELHASTQMTAHNIDSVNFLYSLGYKRVVLSRELSIKEIQHIASNTEAEIEVFSHGALCICYSGQCLMSSMIGGRSGNRGRCAQPCRQKYTLGDNGKEIKSGYLLSPKDLSTIEHMDLLIKSGVKSLKIEGRMKKPEYVAQVVSVYRKAIDSFMEKGIVDIGENDKTDLMKVFNRGGFTTAHLFGKNHGEMISIEKPKNWGIYIGSISNVNKKSGKFEMVLEDRLMVGDGIEIWAGRGDNPGYTIESISVNGKTCDRGYKGQKVSLDFRGGEAGDRVYKTLDAELNKKLEKTYTSKDPLRKIPLCCSIMVQEGMQSQIEMRDDEGNKCVIKGPVPEQAISVPLSEIKLAEQISKMGGTPFYINELDVRLGDNLSLPVSALNLLRRQAIENLTELRLKKYKHARIDIVDIKEKYDEFISGRTLKKKSLKLSVGVNDISLIDGAVDAGADIIVFGGDKFRGYDMDYKGAIEKCRRKGVDIYISSPRIIRNEFSRIEGELEDAMHCGASGIYVQNLGILQYVLDRKMNFSCGPSLNIFNYSTAKTFEDKGSKFLHISNELNLKDIKQFAPYIENCEGLCYGRIEVMVSEYCPMGLCAGCGKKNSTAAPCHLRNIYITDRMGVEFPVKTDIYCRSHIFNSKVLLMIENLKDMLECGINILRVDILDESEEDMRSIVTAFKECLEHKDSGSLPVSAINLAERVKEKGFTKGHYYRGAE